MASVAFEFLGRARVSVDNRELPLSRQCMSFLAYLILHRDIDHPREILLERFWTDQDPRRARSSLGSTLCRLRKALQVGGVSCLEFSPRGELRISLSASIWFDIDAFERGITPALVVPGGPIEASVVPQLISGLNYYRGDLLPGWYDDWILNERERLRALCLQGYRRLVEHYAALGQFEAALGAGRAALAMDPLHEAVQQRVIELYIASGQRVAALRQYKRLVELLKTELAVDPTEEMRALIGRALEQRQLENVQLRSQK